MTQNTIKVLPIEDIFFIKKITFCPKEGREKELGLYGVFYYARRPTEGYKIKESKNIYDISSYLNHNEESFPKDDVDEIIKEAIGSQFSVVDVRTDLQLFDVEKEDYKLLFEGQNGHNVTLKISSISQEQQDIIIELGVTALSYENIKWPSDIITFELPVNNKYNLAGIQSEISETFRKYSDIL